MPLKIWSWNVNGIRSCLGKGFRRAVQRHRPDILCLQETRVDRETAASLGLPEYPYIRFHAARKKGYAGTAVFSSVEPIHLSFGLGNGFPEEEGRVMTCEYESFFLVNAYVPNSQNELRRLPYRIGEWEPALRKHLADLQQRKPVVYCGDLNVAHREIDLARPSANRRSAGFTDEEREAFDRLLDLGMVDSFRALHPDQRDAYSWWSYRGGARSRNVGWRIDYVVLSESLRDRLKEAFIRSEVEGSDHCPVGVCLDPGG